MLGTLCVSLDTRRPTIPIDIELMKILLEHMCHTYNTISIFYHVFCNKLG